MLPIKQFAINGSLVTASKVTPTDPYSADRGQAQIHVQIETADAEALYKIGFKAQDLRDMHFDNFSEIEAQAMLAAFHQLLQPV